MRIDLTSLKKQLRPLIDPAWLRRVGEGKIAIGYDQATTENEMSNPASITVTEREGRLFCQRLIVRFKSADYQIRLAMNEMILDDLREARKRARRFVIDATSEKAAAQMARDQFAGIVPVEYYVGSENIVEGTGKTALKFPAKTLLSDRYRESFEDNTTAMPPDAWILSDHGLVKLAGGRYIVEEDASGNHGDSWISGMLALWGLLSGHERVEAMAVDLTGKSSMMAKPGLHPCFQRSVRKEGPLMI